MRRYRCYVKNLNLVIINTGPCYTVLALFVNQRILAILINTLLLINTFVAAQYNN